MNTKAELTIVIPAKNESRHLPILLTSLSRQDYPLLPHTKVFVADAGSTDGTAVRRLVGPGSGIESSVGIECELIEFPSNGTTFRRVGHDRIAIAYTLSGRGSVDNQTVDAGEAALVDDAAGVAIGGRAGLRLMLTTAPRSA